MKKILISSLFLSLLVIAGTGCLKDKGFDNHEYGINDPDSSPAGVGFPLAAKAKNTVGLEVSASPQVISDVPVLKLFAGEPAQNDIKVTLTLSPALVTAYNTANGTNILPLDPSLYTIATLNAVIPKGSRVATVPITIKNTTTLDPNKSYGIGVVISSADAGYTIASNYKNLLVEFNIKNKYDGIYKLSGFHNRPTLDAPYANITVHMITTGPNSVKMYWPAAGLDAHPINGGVTYYGTLTTEFIFNTTTNLLTGVNNPYTPGSPPFTVGPATDSRWDPATKTIYAQYYYNANLQRMFTDTLRYVGPR
jgi:hypothetical protein